MRLVGVVLAIAALASAQGVITYVPTHPASGGVSCPVWTREFRMEGSDVSTQNLTDSGSDPHDGVNGATSGSESTDGTWVTSPANGLTFASGDYAYLGSEANNPEVLTYSEPNTYCALYSTPSYGSRYAIFGEYEGTGWFFTVSITATSAAEMFARTNGSSNELIINWGTGYATNALVFACIATSPGAAPNTANIDVYDDSGLVSGNLVDDDLDSDPNYAAGSHQFRMGTQETTGAAAGQTVYWIGLKKNYKISSAEFTACRSSVLALKGL